MAKPNAKWYIQNNDFEGAKNRLDSSKSNWRQHWFDTCVEIFNACKDWSKKYIINFATLTIEVIQSIKTTFAPRVKTTAITQSSSCNDWNNSKNIEKCYLIEFFNERMESICSKVGTTKRTIQERIREELNSKTYRRMGATQCVIHRVYECGNIPAEGLESYFRAMYVKRYPQSFKKNDRFIDTCFDLAEADKIAMEYLAV